MLEIRRREFITRLGGAAVSWPLAVRGQQGGRVRRIGVLLAADENDPAAKSVLSQLIQALAGLGWTVGRNVRIDLRGAAVTPIGCERSRRSWSACNLTSS
jgi:putative ABC transport system substrate-binding protein